MRFSTGLVTALLLGATLACTRAPSRPAVAPHAGESAAPASADPNAICPEHGVLEAVCTKCNPALIPVFQAKGDWCAEHGLPESVCPICHPERGGRPSVEVTGAASAHAGARITFKSRESAELAGIKTAVATRASESAGLDVLGRVVPDGSRVAHVNPRAPGVIREVRADVGARVTPGTTLAVIESAELGAAQARLGVAEARVETARSSVERADRLLAGGATSAQDAQVTRRTLAEAEADLGAARSELGVVGDVSGAGRYRVTAPLAGVVTERHAATGEMAHADDVLFVIVDPSVVRVELDVPEDAIAQVAVGGRVVVESETLGGRTFAGTLDYLAPVVDGATRTVKARLTLANPDGALRANMLVRGRVARDDAGGAVTVPAEALHDVEGAAMVFVQRAPDQFESRSVVPGRRDGDLVAIASGLEPGEVVATEGSFILETELLKSSIGSGCCEVD